MNFEKLLECFKLNKQDFIFQFQSHPNYPSALEFSDTLNFMVVKNNAYELEKEYWEELPEEFITIYNNNFGLVKNENTAYKVFSQEVKIISKEDLYKNTSDFVLLFEKEETTKAKSKINYNSLVYGVFGFVILYSFLRLHW